MSGKYQNTMRYTAADIEQMLAHGEDQSRHVNREEALRQRRADPEAPRPYPGWEDTITTESPLQAAQRVPVRVDADLVAWFRSQGAGYQTRINAALRAWVEAHTTDESR